MEPLPEGADPAGAAAAASAVPMPSALAVPALTTGAKRPREEEVLPAGSESEPPVASISGPSSDSSGAGQSVQAEPGGDSAAPAAEVPATQPAKKAAAKAGPLEKHFKAVGAPKK